MPRFSIIMPNYNRAELLAEALQSVQAQTLTDFEVIVVDDGSTDQSVQVARSFDRTRVLLQANAGPGAARNRGIAGARGDYVLFLDSDDLWFPWTLAVIEHAIVSQGQPAVVSGKHLDFYSAADLKRAVTGDACLERYDDLLQFIQRFPTRLPHTSTLAVRRESLQKSGGFLTARLYAEDTDLFLKLGTAPGFVKISAPVTCAVRHHGANISGQLDPWIGGLRHLMATEGAGGYPGGSNRCWQRRSMITFPVRTCAVRCVHQGRLGAAFELYRRTFFWHLRLGRWKFLVFLPAMLVMAACGWRGREKRETDENGLAISGANDR